MKVKQGKVAYIVAEGASHFKNRIAAYTTFHKIQDLPVHVLADRPDFLNKSDIRDTITAIHQVGSVSVVVVDTYAACMQGVDENSGTDAGKVIAHCKEINKATGAVVILIHHSGKDASKGARGWSGLHAAADFELEVVKKDKNHSVTVTKQKDAEEGRKFGFKLKQVPIRMDEEDGIVTSCVVEHSDELSVRGRSGKAKFGDAQRKVLTTIKELNDQNLSWPDRNVLETTITNSTGKRLSNIRRAIDGLISQSVLEEKDGIISLVPVS